jgi:hypothetical protein
VLPNLPKKPVLPKKTSVAKFIKKELTKKELTELSALEQIDLPKTHSHC